MKPKRRKIRLSFIGGRRPAFINKKEEPSDTNIDNNVSKKKNDKKSKVEDLNDKLENYNSQEVAAPILTRSIKDEALISEYASGKNPSKRNNGESSNMLESTICTNNFHDMNELTPELEKELEKWKLLTSDFVFNTFEQVESNPEVTTKCRLLEDQEQSLLQNHMELYKRKLKLKELHLELESKKEILQSMIDKQTTDDSILGGSVVETPRYLIKKIISLN